MATLETLRADNFGGIARSKNSRRFWVPPTAMAFPTGTWTPTFATNVFSQDKTAADNTCVVYVPGPSGFSDMAVEGGAAAVDRGTRVIGLEFIWAVTTAAMDAVTAALFQDTYAATGTLNTAASITFTYDTGHDTAAERLTLDEHRMGLLIAERDRVFLSQSVGIHAEITLDAAATSVVKVFGAIWHCEVVEE